MLNPKTQHYTSVARSADKENIYQDTKSMIGASYANIRYFLSEC
jgi:hypothetical protein